MPGEALVTETHQHTGHARLIHLQLVQKAAAVDKIEAVGLPALLGGLGVAEQDAGIGLMGGGTAAAGDPLDPHTNGGTADVALTDVLAHKRDQLQIPAGDVQAKAHALFQSDGRAALVGKRHVAGDDVVGGVDRIVQAKLTARNGIGQNHFQSLGVL